MFEPDIPNYTGPRPLVRRGRNPLEISMLAVFLVSGIVGLVNPEQSAPSLKAILGLYTWTWHVGLIVGSLTALVGVVAFKPLTDVLIERIGMVWLASVFLAYGLAVLATFGFANTAGGVVTGLGIAFAARAWQITHDIAHLRRVLRSLPTE